MAPTQTSNIDDAPVSILLTHGYHGTSRGRVLAIGTEVNNGGIQLCGGVMVSGSGDVGWVATHDHCNAPLL